MNNTPYQQPAPAPMPLKVMNNERALWKYIVFGPITCGIITLVWYHQMSERLGSEARARGFATNLSAATFWLWFVLGSLIFVGPFVYTYKVCEAMNAVANSYNANGI